MHGRERDRYSTIAGGERSRSRTARHAWQLDELGSRRRHRDADTDPWREPSVGPLNEYLDWPAPGEPEPLVRTYDEVRGFLWAMGLPGGARVHFRHDVLGRLTAVENDTGAVLRRYGYTADGRLAWYTDPDGQRRVWLVHDGAQAVREVAVTDTGQRTDLWSYVWAGSTLLRARYGSSGDWLYAHQDRLGSVVLWTWDDSGALSVAGKRVYEPYGRQV